MNFLKGICILLFFYLLIFKSFKLVIIEGERISNEKQLIKEEGCADRVLHQY
ncbi:MULTISPECIES: hypothetical protein [Staphylococcus]|uniref:hypothetical protein n=1 Tax=Staphylococcus TaxID=1279 RepID=UPI000DFA2818|nr:MULTISPECIES: hypothetical protein [Staphylococcus]MDW4172259.1 hypothetical protein [Staphylococcus saprophyticus]SUN25593.1 Uncharacterised protein [Staphylococcus cohnii]HCY0818131.1 hypothetical protein [Staphylococcus aureus]